MNTKDNWKIDFPKEKQKNMVKTQAKDLLQVVITNFIQ
jgi:hypothetical protein